MSPSFLVPSLFPCSYKPALQLFLLLLVSVYWVLDDACNLCSLWTVDADGLFTKRAQGSLPQTEQYPVIFLPQFRNKAYIKDLPKCVTNGISIFSNNQIFSRYSHEPGNKLLWRNCFANSKSLCRYTVSFKNIIITPTTIFHTGIRQKCKSKLWSLKSIQILILCIPYQ